MKYFIYMAAFIAVFAPGAAHAVAEACITCVSFDGGGTQDCSDTAACSLCNNQTGRTITQNGVTTTTSYCWTSYKRVVVGETAKCDCAATETYTCASGYYGKATSSTTGCTKCPSNATCSGGTTFSCNKGYYKNGSLCSRCPASDGVYGTTSGTGATAITECYIPSGTSFTDSTGKWQYTTNCKYTN